MKLFRHILILSALCAGASYGEDFKLMSSDIADNELMSAEQEFQGFGCDGGNISPQLSWEGAPEGTQAYALTVYDPDAPSGSGWWHWQLVNIPKDVNALEAGAGGLDEANLPEGTITTRNDYGSESFGGACPPQGDDAHRYRFTIYALSQELELPEGASAALTGYMINQNALATSTIEALYKR